MAKEPYPLVLDAVYQQAVTSALPPPPKRGLFEISPEIAMAHQVVGEAIALLEANLLVMRWSGSEATRLTRRGHTALASGDVLGAMTVTR